MIYIYDGGSLSVTEEEKKKDFYSSSIRLGWTIVGVRLCLTIIATNFHRLSCPLCPICVILCQRSAGASWLVRSISVNFVLVSFMLGK